MFISLSKWLPHAFAFFPRVSPQTGLPANPGLWPGPGQRLHLALKVVSCRGLGVSHLWHKRKVYSEWASNNSWKELAFFWFGVSYYSPNPINPLHSQAPVLPRLGLLAVATSNGVVTIYSLPHPDALNTNKKQDNCGKTVKVLPCVVQMLESFQFLWSCRGQCWLSKPQPCLIFFFPVA